MVDQIFEIQWDKSTDETYVGKVLHVGSRAKMSKQAADLASDAADASILTDEGDGRSSRSKKKQKMAHLDSEKGGQHDEVNNFQPFLSEDEMNRMDVSEDRSPMNESEESPATTSSEDSVMESDLIRDLRSKLRQKERRISELKKELSQFRQAEDNSVTIDIEASRRNSKTTIECFALQRLQRIYHPQVQDQWKYH
ncbi:unnamed protein product [Allacma fusca]|uniref:Uncharacterized protein n=1 Tax=Allacma fusca TaxID=39272 RepID=A0A8J2KFI9_9HEXA|nr:unnamed protein product [Allacma fusca]